MLTFLSALDNVLLWGKAAFAGQSQSLCAWCLFSGRRQPDTVHPNLTLLIYPLVATDRLLGRKLAAPIFTGEETDSENLDASFKQDKTLILKWGHPALDVLGMI